MTEDHASSNLMQDCSAAAALSCRVKKLRGAGRCNILTDGCKFSTTKLVLESIEDFHFEFS